MIYLCTHKNPSYSLDCPYEIIDNTKSVLSENYRHLRGMHQLMLRNDLDNEVGVFQQRRRLSVTSIPEGYDIVVPKNFCICHVKNQYALCHNVMDIVIAEKIIGADFTKYISIPNNKECYWDNMFIMKKSDYQKYCEFLFSVLAQHDILSNSDKDDDKLAERITSYWIWKNYDKDKIFIADRIEYPR